jgi:hypothetical protein
MPRIGSGNNGEHLVGDGALAFSLMDKDGHPALLPAPFDRVKPVQTSTQNASDLAPQAPIEGELTWTILHRASGTFGRT